MPGTRTLVADFCMFGLAACDEGGPGFVNESVQTVTNARQVGMRMQRNWHARVGANNASGNMQQTRNMGWKKVCPSNGRADERGTTGVWEHKEAKDAKKIRGIVYENDKVKRTNLVQDEMRLIHHDKQTLLSLWQGWHWDDTKGGWLEFELCAKARRKEVEYIRHHKMFTRVPRETCLA